MNITNEDNMELMSRYEDNYFDLAIVDPPYGIQASSGASTNATMRKKIESGEIKGLRARGGFEIDIKWEANVLKELKINSLQGEPCQIIYNGKTAAFHPQKGEELILNQKLEEI